LIRDHQYDNSRDLAPLDERTNAVDNLEMVDHFLRTLPNPICWKWAIIALHQALYGYAIAAVHGTDPLSVRKNPADPDSLLISIWEALHRTKDPLFSSPGGKPLVTSQDEDHAIERLVKEFRNGFEHFAPAGWSIDVSGMSQIFVHILRVIKGIAIGTHSIRFYDDLEEHRLHEALSRVTTMLQSNLPTANKVL
jgi:hypothetical protein